MLPNMDLTKGTWAGRILKRWKNCPETATFSYFRWIYYKKRALRPEILKFKDNLSFEKFLE